MQQSLVCVERISEEQRSEFFDCLSEDLDVWDLYAASDDTSVGHTVLPEMADGETFLIQTIGPETSGNNSSEASNVDGEVVPCLAVAPTRDAQSRHGPHRGRM